MTKILVTGCAGFIGSHLTEYLLTEYLLFNNLLENKEYKNVEIIGIDNLDPYYSIETKKENLKVLQKYSNFRFYQQDIRTTKIIEEEKPIIVIHLASMAGVRYSLENPIKYTDVNINGMINLLEQSRKNGVNKFLFASSSSVYGKNFTIPFKETDKIENQISPYAVSKKVMEEYGKLYSELYNLNIIGFRFFTVYGPRGRPDMAPYKFIYRIKNGIEIEKYGDGNSMRDYTYIDDIVSGIVGAIKKEKKAEGDFQVYNLGNSKPISLNNFIKTCEKVCNRKAIIKQMGIQKGDVNITYADILKGKKEIGYEPKVKLEEGLRRLYESL